MPSRGLLATAVLLTSIFVGCGEETAAPAPTNPRQERATKQPVSTTSTTSTVLPTTTSAPSAATTAPPPPPSSTTDLGPVRIPDSVPLGERCLWLVDHGYSFAQAAATFDALGSPDDMDADGDEIPCETRYGPEASPEMPLRSSRQFPVQPVEAATWPEANAHGYPATDIYADCGTGVVAVTDGRISGVGTRDDWDPAIDDPATKAGLFVAIDGNDGVRYYASHLKSVAGQLREGQEVASGDAIGTIGNTGNAKDTPCHLHFGLSPICQPGTWDVRRGTIDPRSYLEAWQIGLPASPAAAARAEC